MMGDTQLLPDCNAVSPITNSTLQPDESCNYISAKGKILYGSFYLPTFSFFSVWCEKKKEPRQFSNIGKSHK